MKQHTLSLAEKMFLLSPEVAASELLKLSLLDFIFIGSIEYQPNRSNDRDLRLDSFLKLNNGASENESIVYKPIIEAFSGLSRVQISLFLKDLYRQLGKLDSYKEDYVQKSLIEANLVESSIFNRLLGKVELTKAGEKKRAELVETVQKGKEIEVGNIGMISALLTAEHFEGASDLGLAFNVAQKNNAFSQAFDQFEFLMEDLSSGDLLEPLNLDLSLTENFFPDMGFDFGDSFSFIELF